VNLPKEYVDSSLNTGFIRNGNSRKKLLTNETSTTNHSKGVIQHVLRYGMEVASLMDEKDFEN